MLASCMNIIKILEFIVKWTHNIIFPWMVTLHDSQPDWVGFFVVVICNYQIGICGAVHCHVLWNITGIRGCFGPILTGNEIKNVDKLVITPPLPGGSHLKNDHGNNEDAQK